MPPLGAAPKLNASTSNRVPEPPWKVRYSVVLPAGAPDSAVDTSVKVSQPPVAGTVTEPSTVPVGEPARTESVPPEPPEDTRAVNRFSPASA